MSDARACPFCRSRPLARREGRLEQSGETYLPTVVWSCAVCGYEKWQPALGVRWQSAVEPAGPARRAA